MTWNMILPALLAQLCLALAAPVAEATAAALDNSWQYGTGGGVLGFIILVLDVMVFIEVLKSNRTPASKVLWCLVVFLFPLIGLIIYFLFSNRASHNSGYEPVA